MIFLVQNPSSAKIFTKKMTNAEDLVSTITTIPRTEKNKNIIYSSGFSGKLKRY